MKKLVIICVVVVMCAAAFVTSSANAGMVTVNSWQTEARYDSLSGSVNAGEINITVSGIGGGLDGTLNTFCVETREHITNASYNAQANTVAVKGGEAVSDPLDPETAWLFNQYITGAVILSTTTEMADFQTAIWLWEGEINGPLTTNAQVYYDSAIGKSLGGPDGIGSVRVLNLGTDPTWEYQDLLVPEPATICLLGLGGLALLKKRRA